LGFKLELLSLDPTHPRHNSKSHGFIAHTKRGGNSDASIGWVHTKMKVFDRLPNNLDVESPD
jgi:hypothetical protein